MDAAGCQVRGHKAGGDVGGDVGSRQVNIGINIEMQLLLCMCNCPILPHAGLCVGQSSSNVSGKS